MVEGLTSSAADQGSAAVRDRAIPRTTRSEIGDLRSAPARASWFAPDAADHVPDGNPGDSSGEAIPVPIPNTEVKLSSAEDTERAAFRENRSSPGFFRSSGVMHDPGRVRSSRPGSSRIASAILAAMTDRPGQPSPSSVPASVPEPAPDLPGLHDDGSIERARALCPYLVAADGDWRSVAPAREHACAAVDPPAPVSVDKQRRLCLVAAHIDCATFLAARSVLVEGVAPGAAADRAMTSVRPRWPVPRTTPVVIDRGRGGLPAVRIDRSVAQLGLVALMVLAFAVLAVARLSSDGPVATASPSPSAVVNASPSPGKASPSPSPVASPPPSTDVSPPASAAPSSASSTTYRVRTGDTLSAIAARFGTTVQALRDLNDIADPSLLRVGQVLRLP